MLMQSLKYICKILDQDQAFYLLILYYIIVCYNNSINYNYSDD